LPRRSPWGAKILKGVNNFVTVFSYIVLPSATKFGSVIGVWPIDTYSLKEIVKKERRKMKMG